MSRPRGVNTISSSDSQGAGVVEVRDLRSRLIQAAASILTDEGAEALSMRRVAQLVGCSQMAMYRHFANKEALVQHLCVQLYSQFTRDMERRIAKVQAPWERIRLFSGALIQFAFEHPDHYSLIFLVRHSDPQIVEARAQLGRDFLVKLQEMIREALPGGTSQARSQQCLRQILFCIHGAAALLIAHPEAYSLTEPLAIRDARDAIFALITRIQNDPEQQAHTPFAPSRAPTS